MVTVTKIHSFEIVGEEYDGIFHEIYYSMNVSKHNYDIINEKSR
jgi:hypothetical protein